MQSLSVADLAEKFSILNNYPYPRKNSIPN